MTQITFTREMFWGVEDRVVQLAEFNFKITLFGHFERVLDRFRSFGKACLHFLSRTQIELLLSVLHPLRVREQCLRADADQAIVSMRMLFLDVMYVVGRDQLQPKWLRQREAVGPFESSPGFRWPGSPKEQSGLPYAPQEFLYQCAACNSSPRDAR